MCYLHGACSPLRSGRGLPEEPGTGPLLPSLHPARCPAPFVSGFQGGFYFIAIISREPATGCLLSVPWGQSFLGQTCVA